jgi:hypothetical protein
MQKEECGQRVRRRRRRSFGKRETDEKACFYVDPHKSENNKGRRSNENNINWSQWFDTFSSK